MKEFYKTFMICLALMTSTFSAAVGASSGDSKDADSVRTEFESRFPKPQWWDRVSISGVNIYTYDDLLKYWQNKDRSESQFFKAAYQAILDYPLDTDIVVTGIKLMDYTSETYRHRIELQKYALEKYFTYKSHYGNPGDTIAGVAESGVKSLLDP